MNEKLMFQNAPHVRQSESVLTIMTDVIIALIPLYLMSFFYYGARAVVLGLCGVISCSVFSATGALVSKERPDIKDLTPVITGMIIPLLMPADIPYHIIIAASAVAILVVKFPFGGTGYNLFNPAAVGFASVAMCWPEVVFRYPPVMAKLSVFGENELAAAVSPAHSLAIGAVPDYDVLDMLMGSAPGPMGATNILVIIACGIFLVVRKAVNWRTPAAFIITYGICSALFPRIGGSGFEALCYELFSGTVIFGSFFMLAEPVTSPKRDFGKLMYSAAAGIVVFLFVHFGGFEDCFVYALIIMNVFAPIFDLICENVLHIYRNKDKLEAAVGGDIKKLSAKRPEPVVIRLRKSQKPLEHDEESFEHEDADPEHEEEALERDEKAFEHGYEEKSESEAFV